MEKIRRT